MDYDGQSEYSPIRALYFSARQSGVQVYPNPASDLLYVVLDDASEATATAAITHLSGRLLRTVALVPGQNTLSISDLPPGDYLISVTSDTGVTTLRFVVVP